jgi:hypothetical protein
MSQDSIASIITNATGWMIREPNAATLLDGGVLGYDILRSGNQPLIPEFINPSLAYNLNKGFTFGYTR